MQLKHILIIVLASVFAMNCKTAKLVQENQIKEVFKDSITTVTITPVKDTVIVASDSLKFRIPISKLSEKPVIKSSKSGRTTARVSKQNNHIEVECYVEEYMAIIETQNKTIETLIKVLENKQTTKTLEVYKMRWYEKTLLFIGFLALIVFVFHFVKR